MMKSNQLNNAIELRSSRVLRRIITKQRFGRVRKSWQLTMESIYSAIDKRLGRRRESLGELTTDFQRLRKAIDERAIDRGPLGCFAPHHFIVRINHAALLATTPKALRALELEVLAEAIDYINDNRYQTFRPVDIQVSSEVFTNGIIVEPTFGEAEKFIKNTTARARYVSAMKKVIANVECTSSEFHFVARFSVRGNRFEENLVITPGTSHLNVGRAAENDLFLDHPTVSLVHAAIAVDKDGQILVADTGSMAGTFINERRLAVGTSSRVTNRDHLCFGDVQVHIRAYSD